MLYNTMGLRLFSLNCGNKFSFKKYGEKYIIANYSLLGRRLPNEVIMAKELLKTMTDYKYDLTSGEWFEYIPKLGQWTKINKFQIDQKIFLMLDSHNDVKGLLTNDYKNKVRSSLELLNGVNFESYRSKNKELKHIPFLNGVLDLKNNTLLAHSKEYYFNYGLNLNYQPEAKLSNNMIKFLCSISNNNVNTLRVLRSFIQCVLLRDNQYQVALYLFGPGGTGKSTFEKLLISLVGSSNASVLNIEDLNKQFTLSKIIDKSLVLFSDVQCYTGDPSKLRLLISGDVMNAERKYKDSFDLQPNSLVVLSSNVLWSPKDASTGLQRRIIYIPMTTVPTTVDRNLFIYNLATNETSGTLVDSLPGLVNWALNNTDANLNLLNNAVNTNKLLSDNVLNSTNPLIEWLESYISYEYDSVVNIGKKDSNPKTHLYPNYLQFCRDYGYKPLAYNIFSSILVQQLNSLLSSDIYKKKNYNGTVIANIKLSETVLIKSNVNDVNDVNYIASAKSSLLNEFKDYAEDPDYGL